MLWSWEIVMVGGAGPGKAGMQKAYTVADLAAEAAKFEVFLTVDQS